MYVCMCLCVWGVGVLVEVLSHTVDQRTSGAFALGEIPAQLAVRAQQGLCEQKFSQTNTQTRATRKKLAASLSSWTRCKVKSVCQKMMFVGVYISFI